MVTATTRLNFREMRPATLRKEVLAIIVESNSEAEIRRRITEELGYPQEWTLLVSIMNLGTMTAAEADHLGPLLDTPRMRSGQPISLTMFDGAGHTLEL